MKIAIIGSKALDSLESNLLEAFSFNGHTCEIFDIASGFWCENKITGSYFTKLDWLRRQFYDAYDQKVFQKIFEQVADYRPDLVIGVYRFIHPSFVKRVKTLGCKVIHLNPDQLTTFEYQQVFASDYDVWFTKDPYIVSFMTRNMQLNAKLYNEAFSLRLHPKPAMDKATCEEDVNIDVMTYGTMYPYRCRMLKVLTDKRIDVKVFGVKPSRFYDSSLDIAFQNKYIVQDEKSKLLFGSKIVFNQMHYAEVESVNNRFFEANGAGAFQLSDYKPILHDLLPVDPELVSFKSIDEGVEKIKYYLENTEERHAISEKIYDHFVHRYTYDHLTQYLLEEL